MTSAITLQDALWKLAKEDITHYPTAIYVRSQEWDDCIRQALQEFYSLSRNISKDNYEEEIQLAFDLVLDWAKKRMNI